MHRLPLCQNNVNGVYKAFMSAYLNSELNVPILRAAKNILFLSRIATFLFFDSDRARPIITQTLHTHVWTRATSEI
jgi:hypothetical protein